MSVSTKYDDRLFDTPFSKGYWGLAAKELTETRVLVLAAILTALRIAVKGLSIPVGPNLNITFGFIINSLGSMIYGPVVAIIASAISDTLGAILFPSGVYFFPFIFEEIAGGLIFALFYYRTKLTTRRIIFGRFMVTVICNLIINPICMYYYYMLVMGKSYTLFTLPRVIKNLSLFPLQALFLIVFFRAFLPYTNRMGYTHTGETKLKIGKNEIIEIAVMTVVAAAAVGAYYLYLALR